MALAGLWRHLSCDVGFKTKLSSLLRAPRPWMFSSLRLDFLFKEAQIAALCCRAHESPLDADCLALSFSMAFNHVWRKVGVLTWLTAFCFNLCFFFNYYYRRSYFFLLLFICLPCCLSFESNDRWWVKQARCTCNIATAIRETFRCSYQNSRAQHSRIFGLYDLAMATDWIQSSFAHGNW